MSRFTGPPDSWYDPPDDPPTFECDECGEDVYAGAECEHCGTEAPSIDDLREAAEERKFDAMRDEGLI